jgi:biotin synthase
MENVMSVSDRIEKLLLKAEIGKPLLRDEILELLKMPGDFSPDLFDAADRVRKNDVGDEIYLRGIIEFSNFCERNCLYCGLRKGNTRVERYRMTGDEILKTAEDIRKAGISTCVLQSGEDSFYTADTLCALVESIKKETGLVLTLSIGERPMEDLRAFQQAGANRYLLKHETASPELYSYLRPGCKLSERVRCLKTLKELGFETGTGNMVGLPGQTNEILADDLQLMKMLDADMLGIGPFIPHPYTPLNGIDHDDVDLTLRVLAIARLLTRNTNIPATTAMATLHPQGRLLALQAGANVVMPDFTPEIYKRRYDIYPGRKDVGNAADILRHLEKEFTSIGRTLLYSIGHRRLKTDQGILH